jgi:N-acetylmuramoyl-L-alanine amidase
MKLQKVHSPNFTEGRPVKRPLAAVIHSTEGTEQSAISWIQKPASRVSYHYLVRRNGEVIQFVDEKDTAWHAGAVVGSSWSGLKHGANPNDYTIGMAFAGWADEGPSQKQISALAELVFEAAVRWNWKIDEHDVIGHREIRTDKTCPGDRCDLAVLRGLARLPVL